MLKNLPACEMPHVGGKVIVTQALDNNEGGYFSGPFTVEKTASDGVVAIRHWGGLVKVSPTHYEVAVPQYGDIVRGKNIQVIKV